jgi:hypothetical protein
MLNPVNKKRSTKREFHVTNTTEYGHFDMDIGKVWIADADVLDNRVWHPHPWIRRINHYKSETSVGPQSHSPWNPDFITAVLGGTIPPNARHALALSPSFYCHTSSTTSSKRRSL